MTAVTATFYGRPSAERAIKDLASAGVVPKNVSVVMSKETRDRYSGVYTPLGTSVLLSVVLTLAFSLLGSIAVRR